MFSIIFFFVLCSISAQAIPPRNNPSVDDQFSELDGELVLRFFDAVNGQPLAQATVTFEGQTVITDTMGAARFAQPDEDLILDYKTTATISKNGYISAEIPIVFMAGSLWHNRFAVSPNLQSDKMRIVLDWSKKPRDLDAHLIKSTMSNQEVYHISFHDMKRHEDKARLDIDDKNGEGPETITIVELDSSASYRYFVHDYSNKNSKRSKELSESRAHVSVYDSRGLVRSFSVPYDETGIIWDVFEIRQGEIRPVNRLANEP